MCTRWVEVLKDCSPAQSQSSGTSKVGATIIDAFPSHVVTTQNFNMAPNASMLLVTDTLSPDDLLRVRKEAAALEGRKGIVGVDCGEVIELPDLGDRVEMIKVCNHDPTTPGPQDLGRKIFWNLQTVPSNGSTIEQAEFSDTNIAKKYTIEHDFGRPREEPSSSSTDAYFPPQQAECSDKNIAKKCMKEQAECSGPPRDPSTDLDDSFSDIEEGLTLQTEIPAALRFEGPAAITCTLPNSMVVQSPDTQYISFPRPPTNPAPPTYHHGPYAFLKRKDCVRAPERKVNDAHSTQEMKW